MTAEHLTALEEATSTKRACELLGLNRPKYCPAFPRRVGSIADARVFCAEFFDHYNHVHRHSGIRLHTPASLHYGTTIAIRAARTETLTATNHRPRPSSPPSRESTNPTEQHSSHPTTKSSHPP